MDELLVQSVKRMPLNQLMLGYVRQLRARGVTVSLFTNNMDVFDAVSVPYHGLGRQFDFIYSSSGYGRLKLEDDSLLREALRDSQADIAEAALVDDSPQSCKAAKGFGMAAFEYANYDESQAGFEEWVLGRYRVGL